MATTILRPNGDGATLQWTPTPSGTHYTTIDEVVTNPTAGDITDYISATLIAKVDIVDLETISGDNTCSQVVVNAYVENLAGQSSIKVSIYMGGAWQTDVTLTDAVKAWRTATFNGSWVQTDINAMKIRFTSFIPIFGQCWVYTAYANVTYVSLAVAADANFFGPEV